MRAHEFILEKISLVEYTPAFEKAIDNAVLQSFKDMLIMNLTFGLSKEELTYNDEIGFPMKKYLDGFAKEFSDILQYYLLVNLREKSNEILPSKSRQILFKFSRGISALGTATYSGNKDIVSLNYEYYIQDGITKKIKGNLYHSIIDSFSGDNSLDSLMKEVLYFYIKHNSQLFGYYRDLRTKMAGTVVHELVHVEQHRRQFERGRQNTEYRSYVEPDKNKFYQAIKKFSSPTSTDTESDQNISIKLHRSSPQEITAISHDIVNKIVSVYDLDKHSLEYLRDVRKNFTANDLKYFVDEYIDHFDPKHRVENKIRQRYLKSVYRELMDVFDRLENKLEKQT